MSSIHRLAGPGDIYELHALLEAGADPNERSAKDGKTPLMMAAKANNRVAIKLLLKYGADLEALDKDGLTALYNAIDVEMKRFLLAVGADPDHGRIGGMTLLALSASFGDREMLDLYIAHGADAGEKLRDGKTVQELLDDPKTHWRSEFPSDTPEIRERHARAICKFSEDLDLSPEEYVARNRTILVWSYSVYPFNDPAHAYWAKRVSELLASPKLREQVYQRYLEGDELADALRSVTREKAREERNRLREERLAQFEAEYI